LSLIPLGELVVYGVSCQLVNVRVVPINRGSSLLESRVDSGLEIRRLLLLTRLKDIPKGLTLPQLVKDCGKVSGWSSPGKTVWEIVQHVVQTLIDDKLVALGTSFVVTVRGREYLEDPLKWHIDERTTEELADNMFWKEIYDVFDKAYRRLRSKIPR
jgi:hypothetical protein